MATPPRGRERKPRCGAARAPRFPRSRRPSASKSSRTRGQGSDLPAGHTVRVRAAPRPSKSTPLPVSLGQLAQCRDGSGGRGVRGAVAAHRRRRSTLALDPHVCWLRLVPPRVHPTEHVQVRAAHPQRRPSGAWWQWRSPALHSRRGSSARRDGSTRMPVRTL